MPMRLTVLFLFLGVNTVLTQAQVRVWEGVLNLPAYEEGAPDPNPPFDQFATGRFNYPYTMRNKISEQPMFYANPSIKKARIGYRGAWAAFGVEFNFPVSHNWVSMSPVDFAHAGHEDGSASVTVGNVDRVYGMEWSVELTLRPGSTVLEQHVR